MSKGSNKFFREKAVSEAAGSAVTNSGTDANRTNNQTSEEEKTMKNTNAEATLPSGYREAESSFNKVNPFAAAGAVAVEAARAAEIASTSGSFKDVNFFGNGEKLHSEQSDSNVGTQEMPEIPEATPAIKISEPKADEFEGEDADINSLLEGNTFMFSNDSPDSESGGLSKTDTKKIELVKAPNLSHETAVVSLSKGVTTIEKVTELIVNAVDIERINTEGQVGINVVALEEAFRPLKGINNIMESVKVTKYVCDRLDFMLNSVHLAFGQSIFEWATEYISKVIQNDANSNGSVPQIGQKESVKELLKKDACYADQLIKPDDNLTKIGADGKDKKVVENDCQGNKMFPIYRRKKVKDNAAVAASSDDKYFTNKFVEKLNEKLAEQKGEAAENQASESEPNEEPASDVKGGLTSRAEPMPGQYTNVSATDGNNA